MSKKIIGGLIAVLMVVVLTSRVAFAATTEDVTLTVTPVGDVSILATLDNYNFGSVDLKTSTESATAISLSNDGEIGVRVEKGCTADDDWDVTLSSTVNNGFDVFVATSATRPSIADFEGGDNEITTLQAVDASNPNLTGVGNTTQTILGVGASVNTWYMIRMPVTSSNNNPKTIIIRFTASAL